MNKIKAYFEEVSSELLTKVTWPTWSELQESAIIVMIASVIIAMVVGVMDLGFNKLMALIYSL